MRDRGGRGLAGRRMSVTRTASSGWATSSRLAATGAPANRGVDAAGSITATIVMPLSSAQIMAISARSDTPRSAIRVKPRSRAAANAAVQSVLARRNSESEYDMYSTVSRDFSAKPLGVR